VGQALPLKNTMGDKITKDEAKIESASNMNIALTTNVSCSRPTIHICTHLLRTEALYTITVRSNLWCRLMHIILAGWVLTH
jgi:hypothetical protein